MYKNKEFCCRRIYKDKKSQLKLTYRCKNTTSCSTSLTVLVNGSIKESKNFKHTCSDVIKREFPSKMNNHDYSKVMEFISSNEENLLM